MGVSERHTRGLLEACRERGAAALAHGHRGRRAPNATPEPVATAVVHLARTRYAGVNHTHLSELLSERERIDIGRSTLRRIPVNAGLSSPPGGAPGLVLASGGIGNHYPPSSAGNRPGPPGQSPAASAGRGTALSPAPSGVLAGLADQVAHRRAFRGFGEF